MYRNSTQLRATRRTGLARMALAAALASGMILGSTAISAAAQAKQAKKGAKEEKEANTQAFADVYQPLAAIVNAPDGDNAAAKAQIPTVVAAIGNDTDKYTMANLILALGNKTNDEELQAQGIRMILDSGKAEPASIGQMHYYLARWAYDAKNYPEARAQFQTSVDAGYTEGEPAALIAETYFGEGRAAEGLDYLTKLIESRRAAGQDVPGQWLLRGLKIAYDSQSADMANTYATWLVQDSPTKDNWIRAIQVVNALNDLDGQSQLDLFRLMAKTGSLSQRAELVQYVSGAQNGGLPNEMLSGLKVGIDAGVISEDDPYYKEAKALAEVKLEEDVGNYATLAEEARASATGVIAQSAGDVFLSNDDFAQSAQMYQLALDKGVKDRELILSRLGMAQAIAGQAAEAQATLKQVTGPRAVVARLWMAYSKES